MTPILKVKVYGQDSRDPSIIGRYCHGEGIAEILSYPWSDVMMPCSKCATNGLPVCPVEENNDLIDSDEYIEFDSNLRGDAWGRLAALLRDGIDVRNQVMKAPEHSEFYGKVLSSKYQKGDVCMIPEQFALQYFPELPIAATRFACRTSAVRVKNSQEFRDKTGIEEEEIDLLFASPWMQGTEVLMNFYSVFGGVAVYCRDGRDLDIPLFRNNRGYRRQVV